MSFVATSQGFFRFTAAGGPRFTAIPPRGGAGAAEATSIVEDRAGTVWAGTTSGVYRLGREGLEYVALGIAGPVNVRGMENDGHGGLWIATSSGLFHRTEQGGIERYTTREGLPSDSIQAVALDAASRTWAGTDAGAARLVERPEPGRAAVESVFGVRDGMPAKQVLALLTTRRGRVWAGTGAGLVAFDAGGTSGPRIISVHTASNGLTDAVIRTLAEDRHGQLWAGTQSAGAMKIPMSGFTGYGTAEGVAPGRVMAITEDSSGRLMIESRTSGVLVFDGSRFGPLRVRIGEGRRDGSDGIDLGLRSHGGEWWTPAGGAVLRYRKADRSDLLTRKTGEVMLSSRGSNAATVVRIQDQRGDMWIARTDPAGNTLSRWERGTRTLHEYSDADGWPGLQKSLPTVFRDDRRGRLWIGHAAGVVTYAPGRSPAFVKMDRIPGGYIRDIYLDSAGRLWLGSVSGGVIRIDHPEVEQPSFVQYTTAEGLSDNQARCIAEDLKGNIYIGGPKGVNRIDPGATREFGNVKHYTTSDGLDNNYLNSAFRDHAGALWFGTMQGISRLVPEPDIDTAQPLPLLNGLSIRGVSQPVSPFGDPFRKTALESNQNQLQIDFAAPGFPAGDGLRYQYKLEGAEAEWSAPTDERSVNYASVAPGSYRFIVRTVKPHGGAGPHATLIELEILPPLWRRWWFELIACLGMMAAAFAAYRRRVAHVRGVQAMRTRIATDIHDDVGASLSQIAILSEVARRQIPDIDGRRAEPLARIAAISRELIDSVSQIVWAIDPHHDTLLDLTRRIRQFAGEMFVARDMELTFEGPSAGSHAPIDPDRRRAVYLIFKECANNVVRHSGSGSVDVRLHLEGGSLSLAVRDHGRGFDPAAVRGHGIASMRARAERIGGTLAIVVNDGTTVTLTVPMRMSRAPRIVRRFTRG